MLKKIKNYLGIEGVSVELVMNDTFDIYSKELNGSIQLTSQSDQFIQTIHLRLVEKYRRGRGDKLLINEYILGEKVIDIDIPIAKNETRLIAFKLAYDILSSEMDDMEKRSALNRPFVWLAKKMKNVKSEYRIEATAEIKGTKLQPMAVKLLETG